MRIRCALKTSKLISIDENETRMYSRVRNEKKMEWREGERENKWRERGRDTLLCLRREIKLLVTLIMPPLSCLGGSLHLVPNPAVPLLHVLPLNTHTHTHTANNNWFNYKYVLSQL